VLVYLLWEKWRGGPKLMREVALQAEKSWKNDYDLGIWGVPVYLLVGKVVRQAKIDVGSGALGRKNIESISCITS
jgi:hypothetical protein